MMRSSFLIIATLITFASTGFAKEINMICLTGDATDMDLKIESSESGLEKLSVTLTAMDGETIRVYVNSKFKDFSLTRGMQEGGIDALVSKSDLEQQFGGAYLDAGMVHAAFNKDSKKYDVLFAAEGQVYTGACSE